MVYKCDYHIVCVSKYQFSINTVGLNEEMIKRYVKYQEEVERKEERDQNDFN